MKIIKRTFCSILCVWIIMGIAGVSNIASYAKSLGMPSSVKLISKAAGFTVRFKKAKNKVSGYKIKYSSKKSFSNSKTMKISASKTSKTVKNLKQGKRYYVKVCAYKGSTNSKWTKEYSIVTKLSSEMMKKKLIKGFWVSFSTQSTTCQIHAFHKDGTVNIKELYIDIRDNKKIYQDDTWISYSVGASIAKLYYSQYTITWKYNSLKNLLFRHYEEKAGPQAGESGTLKMKWYSSYPSTSQLLEDMLKR